MMGGVQITEATLLKPLDVLINPFGELYRIVRYYCDKNSFIINEFDKPVKDDEQASLIVTRETLIDRIWNKLDYKELLKFIFQQEY